MKRDHALPQQRKLRDLAGNMGRAERDLDGAEEEFNGDARARRERSERNARRTRLWYPVALFGVGSAEWLINYNSMDEVFGVPMFAIGATALVALFVAFASHEHGLLCKQPYMRDQCSLFSSHFSSGHFALCIVSFILLGVALGGVGWARYVLFADLSAIGVEIAVWPRVAIAVGFNAGVWGVGLIISYKAHSKGYYTTLQKDFERARARHRKAQQKMNTLRHKLIPKLSHDQEREMEQLIEEEREKSYSETRPQGARVKAVPLIASLAVALSAVDAGAQVITSIYDIAQFCEDATVAEAQPFRKTVVYIDEWMVRPQNAGPPPSTDAGLDQWREGVAAALANADWYGQLEAKLQASLLPSEEVMVVSIAADGTPRERSRHCWPGYTAAQLAEIMDVGRFQRLFRSDPVDDLETQRQVFFGSIRYGLAEALSQDATGGGGPSTRYLRVLSRDEGRLRTTRGAFVRVIWYGHMMEDSEYGSIRDTTDAAAMAKRAVEQSSLRLGGASFYVYGVEDEDRARAFWDEVLSSAGGQLAAFGPDLALTAKVPERLARLLLEIETPPTGVREARATLLVAEDGELLDSALVVAGSFRSALQGTFVCGEPEDAGDLCASDCALEARTQRTVLYETMDEETLLASGTGAELRGSIGHPDDRPESHRTYAPVAGAFEGCGI